MSVKVLIDYFSAELGSRSQPIAAEKMAAYMKGRFSFYGVHAPMRSALIGPIWQSEKPLITKEIRPLVNQLWSKNEREYQMIALELLRKCKTFFGVEDLPFLETLICTKSWWDTVDILATTMIGGVLKSDPRLAKQTARCYMDGDNQWLQRTALLFQLKYKDAVDEELLYELIDKTKGSKEFFINKASGWALRQYSKFNPDSVASYIDENRGELANLALKEGSKYL